MNHLAETEVVCKFSCVAGGYSFGRFVVAPPSGATIFRNVKNYNIPEDLNVHQHQRENLRFDDTVYCRLKLANM
jgi:hypothetical protein